MIIGLYCFMREMDNRLKFCSFVYWFKRLMFFYCVFGEIFKYLVVISFSCFKILYLKFILDIV